MAGFGTVNSFLSQTQLNKAANGTVEPFLYYRLVVRHYLKCPTNLHNNGYIEQKNITLL